MKNKQNENFEMLPLQQNAEVQKLLMEIKVKL